VEPLVLGLNRSNREHQAILLVALAKGYFTKQGFEVSLRESETLPLLQSGEVDASAEYAGVRLYQAWNPDQPPRIVADAGSYAEGRGQGFIIARRALLDAGELRDYGQLRGKRIAMISTPGESDWLLFFDALRLGGITFADVEILHTDDRPTRMSWFADGTIDLSQEGTVRGAVYGREQGTFGIWKRKYEVAAGRPFRVLTLSYRFWSERPDAARRCVGVFLQALRDYHDAFETGQGQQEFIAILASQTGYRPEDLWEFFIPDRVDRDGRLNVDGLARNARDLQEAGLLDPTFAVERMIDDSFRQAALSV
jgi:ABC-type nitrate/sulfonate/bicarbonate transport system substrate-binding protein